MVEASRGCERHDVTRRIIRSCLQQSTTKTPVSARCACTTTPWGEEGATKTGARAKVGGMLDIKPATLHNWIRKAKAAATVETTATQEVQAAELAKLRKENAQLKEANEILKLASASFAQAELDRTLK